MLSDSEAKGTPRRRADSRDRVLETDDGTGATHE